MQSLILCTFHVLAKQLTAASCRPKSRVPNPRTAEACFTTATLGCAYLERPCPVAAEQVLLPCQEQRVHAMLVPITVGCVEDGLHSTAQQATAQQL